MLVGLPAGAFQIGTVWFGALVPMVRKNIRSLTGIILVLIPLTGSLILTFLPAKHSWGIVASTWLAGCTSAPLSIAVQLMASNVKGNTKKSVVSAIFFIGYCIGCICGPQLWQSEDAPRYVKGCITSITSWFLLVASFTFMWFNLQRVNRKRDREAAARGTLVADNIGVSENSDMTEKQDRDFRFTT
jgi:MFS transporter, ACS family, allantoate permease